MAQNSEKIWTYSSSRSSKVNDFGTDRKRIVINSNFGPILHRSWDTATYWLKLCIFHTPLLFGTPAPMFPLEFQGEALKLSTRKLETWGYSVVKVAWSWLQPSFTDPPVWRTDRQTDGRTETDRQTDGRTDGRWHIVRYSIYAVVR